MSNKVNKIYNKAMDKYTHGKMKEALRYCEIGISEDIANGAILNLKGLLLYLRGDLDGAISTWKVNSQHNNDSLAKVYLEDSKGGYNKIDLFVEGETLLKNLKVDKALSIFKECGQSDFNAIKVNNAIASCYIKKAMIKEAKEHINKVLELDIQDKEALLLKKEIDSFSSNNKNKIIVKICLLTAVVLIISVSIIIIGNKNKNNINKEELVQNNNEESESYVNDNKEEITTDRNDSEGEINSSEVLLSDLELEQAYNKGVELYEEGRYTEAISLLDGANKSTYKNYLAPHILYFLGLSYEGENDKEAIAIYEEYVDEYPQGSYIEEVYNRLAILLQYIDSKRSRQYANKLITYYPKSIYSDSPKIQEILSN